MTPFLSTTEARSSWLSTKSLTSLPTGTIGTRLVMEAIQVVALSGSAGVDVGDAEDIDPAADVRQD